jgi:hypothetical protein
MNEITLGQARSLAMDALNKLAERQGVGHITIIDESIVETETAWYFPYDARDFLLHGDVSSALTGNLPVKVSRDGTTISYEAPEDFGHE